MSFSRLWCMSCWNAQATQMPRRSCFEFHCSVFKQHIESCYPYLSDEDVQRKRYNNYTIHDVGKGFLPIIYFHPPCFPLLPLLPDPNSTESCFLCQCDILFLIIFHYICLILHCIYFYTYTSLCLHHYILLTIVFIVIIYSKFFV